MSMKGGKEPVGFILIRGTASRLCEADSEQDDNSCLRSTFHI